MPEGDTLHSLAGLLTPLLRGRVIDRIEIRTRQRRQQLSSQRVLAVQAHGKHLLIELAQGLTLRVHLGLYGSWHRYAPGESWRKPRHQARLVLHLDGQVHACFNAREVELTRTGGHRQRDLRARIGPDLARAAPDLGEVVRRARALEAPGAPLADLLLDQRVAGGIGNVFKCETLFLARLHPLRRLDSLDDRDLRRVFTIANRLLCANVGGGARDTRGVGDGAGHLWVYGRGGRPCLACGQRIVADKTGRRLRLSYWCPSCQPASL